MKCIVKLSGKLDEKIELDVDYKLLENGDTSELYDLIVGFFPQNDWEDLCCDSVKYTEEILECYLTVI